MNSKEFPLMIFSVFIGIYILTMILKSITTLISFFIFKFVELNILNDWLWIVFTFFNLFVLIYGFKFGLRSFKLKNLWYDIFKITRSKIILSIVLSLIFSSAFYFIDNRFLFLSGTIFGVLVYYPFSALVEHIYVKHKKNTALDSKVIIILLIIFLNPLTLVLAQSVSIMYDDAIWKKTCGVQVVSFVEGSVLKGAGMNLNETIIKINDFNIRTNNDLLLYMASYDPSSNLIVRTENNFYEVTPKYLDGKYLLGINIYNKFCKR